MHVIPWAPSKDKSYIEDIAPHFIHFRTNDPSILPLFCSLYPHDFDSVLLFFFLFSFLLFITKPFQRLCVGYRQKQEDAMCVLHPFAIFRIAKVEYN